MENLSLNERVNAISIAMKLFSALDMFGPYPFDIVWPDVKVVYHPKDIDGDGVLVVWGGEDISPSIYGERVSKYTGADDRPSRRDELEMSLINKQLAKGNPIIGICRGAQLMCAFTGGKVIQHVTGHGRSHDITTKDKRVLRTTSLHHQMMQPFDVEHELIAWASEQISTCYIGENDKDVETPPNPEPEVVYFPTTKTLAIQGHPEFINNPRDAYVQYCLELARKYCES